MPFHVFISHFFDVMFIEHFNSLGSIENSKQRIANSYMYDKTVILSSVLRGGFSNLTRDAS